MNFDIFQAYEQYSHRILNEDETLSKYEEDMQEKTQYVKNLMIMTDGLTILTHPIRLIRTKMESRRLRSIFDEYYELKDSPLVEHFDEESGELDVDLRNAAEFSKPRRMRKFTELYPIYREEDSKMLKMKK